MFTTAVFCFLLLCFEETYIGMGSMAVFDQTGASVAPFVLVLVSR